MISRDLSVIATAVAAGEVVAYPTEGCYGLGCHPLHQRAVGRVIRIKGRPVEAGLILIGASYDQLRPYILESRVTDLDRIRECWPGPVTWVMPAAPGTPCRLTGGRATIAVRVTGHPLARRLCQLSGTALVSTSANRHGRAPARSARGAQRELLGKVGWILHGAIGAAAGPSEIRDAGTGRIIRAA